MAEENGMRITIAHISTDYRALNYVSDSLRDDRVSQEVIQAKARLNELACTVSLLSLIHILPGADYVDRVMVDNNRPPAVLRNMQTLYNTCLLYTSGAHCHKRFS